MQEQLVYSTFSRARQSVISRTRRAFTPRGLIKEGAENADKDIGVDKPPVGQDLEEVMHSEPKAPAPDRVKASRQEQTRDYMAQITTLEKRIKELEENKAEYAKSREGLTRQVADYERKVKDLEAENHGSTERLSSYTKQIEKLEDTIENSRSNESDHQARVKNYQAQLDELGKEVDELQKAQLRFDHTNVSVENLKREIELRDETIDNRKKEIGVLTSNLGQLKNQVEEQRNIIATQKQSMEGKQTEIALLQQTAREQVKDHGQNRDELRNKDIEISRLQAAIGQAKEAAAKAQTLDSNQKMEELRKKDSEISKLQNEAKQQVEDSNQKMNDLRDKDIEISQLQKVAKAQAEQFDQKMAELRNKDVEISQLRVAIEEAKEAAVEKQAKDTQQNSDDLRQKDMEIFQLQQAIVEAKESTPKNANSMPNMPLQRSEDEIIRDWQVLADLVEKFVSDAFGEVEFKQIRRWVRAQGVERLPAHSSPLVVGDVYTSRLVEAAIWNNLSQLVFGQSSLDSGMCWAGSSASKVSKLSTLLLQLMGKADQKTQGLFQLWKATTTDLLTSLGPQGGRDEKVMEVVGNLLSLVMNLPTRLSREDLIESLTAIVNQAVLVDETLCRQTSWFFARYPDQRVGVNVDGLEMEQCQGVMPGEVVKFVVRPALCRAGTNEEESDKILFLKQSLVFI